MLKGIDISSHQGDVEFDAIKKAGYAFVIIKVTGGDRYVNEFWYTQYMGALAADMAVGFYHYDAEPTFSTGTALEEAHHFVNTIFAAIGGPPAGSLLALDAEERATRDPERYRAWLDEVERMLDVRPLFYSYPNFIAELGPEPWRALAATTDLWLASYDDPPLATVAPWHEAVIVQVSGGSAVPGTHSPTDVNVFDKDLDGDGDSDRDDLATLGKQKGYTAMQEAYREPPTEVTAFINDRREPCILINFKGQAKGITSFVVIDAGISVIGDDDANWHRSQRVYEDLAWVRNP